MNSDNSFQLKENDEDRSVNCSISVDLKFESSSSSEDAHIDLGACVTFLGYHQSHQEIKLGQDSSTPKFDSDSEESEQDNFEETTPHFDKSQDEASIRTEVRCHSALPPNINQLVKLN